MRKKREHSLRICCFPLLISSAVVSLYFLREHSSVTIKYSDGFESNSLGSIASQSEMSHESFSGLYESDVCEKTSADLLLVSSNHAFDASFEQHLAIGVAYIHDAVDPFLKGERKAQWIQNIAVSDSISAIKFLRESKMPSSLRNDLEVRLIQRWAKQDPIGTSAWVNLNPSMCQQVNLVKALAITWSIQDLESAIVWASELDNDEEWSLAQRSISYEAVRTDPIAALILAIDLPVDSASDHLILYAASEWAISDSEAALEWGMQIEDKEMSDRVLSTIARSMAASTPVAAAKLAVDLLPPGRLQNDTILSITQRWSRNDPESVWNWIKYFPRGELRHTALENLVQQQLDYDLQATYSWISAVEPGTNYVEVMAIYQEILKRKSGAYISNATH